MGKDKIEELCLIAARTRSKEKCIDFTMNPKNILSMLRLWQVLDALSLAGVGSTFKYRENKRFFYFCGREGTGKTYMLEKIEEEARREGS